MGLEAQFIFGPVKQEFENACIKTRIRPLENLSKFSFNKP